jgi:hypothetical protein
MDIITTSQAPFNRVVRVIRGSKLDLTLLLLGRGGSFILGRWWLVIHIPDFAHWLK